MRQKSKKWLFGMLGCLALASAIPVSGAAQAVYVGAPAYGSPYYYPRTVVAEPLLLPRTGSNDYIYTYDNVYGAGASAAGRMDRVVNNPQPQLYIPRQQPRVYIGY